MISTEDISSDNRVVLRNAHVAQKLSIGTAWTTLRIGMRVSFTDIGENIHGQPRLWIGVMTTPTAGMTNGPLSLTAPHFLGISTNVINLARAAGPPVRWDFSGAGSMRYVKLVDGTVTETLAAPTLRFPGSTTVRWPFILQIVKGAPNYTLSFCYPNGAGYGDHSEATLVNAMDSATLAAATAVFNAAVAGSVGDSSAASISLAVDEGADGDLDSICVAWDRSYPAMHLSELLFYKVA
jgi:hypothetical protein